MDKFNDVKPLIVFFLVYTIVIISAFYISYKSVKTFIKELKSERPRNGYELYLVVAIFWVALAVQIGGKLVSMF